MEDLEYDYNENWNSNLKVTIFLICIFIIINIVSIIFLIISGTAMELWVAKPKTTIILLVVIFCMSFYFLSL